MNELLPCPFCGEKTKLEGYHAWVDGSTGVFCMTCMATGPAAWEPQNSAVLWNKRAKVDNANPA